MVRLSDVELEEIERAAEGAPLATWLRELGLRAARRHK